MCSLAIRDGGSKEGVYRAQEGAAVGWGKSPRLAFGGRIHAQLFWARGKFWRLVVDLVFAAYKIIPH